MLVRTMNELEVEMQSVSFIIPYLLGLPFSNLALLSSTVFENTPSLNLKKSLMSTRSLRRTLMTKHWKCPQIGQEAAR